MTEEEKTNRIVAYSYLCTHQGLVYEKSMRIKEQIPHEKLVTAGIETLISDACDIIPTAFKEWDVYIMLPRKQRKQVKELLQPAIDELKEVKPKTLLQYLYILSKHLTTIGEGVDFEKYGN